MLTSENTWTQMPAFLRNSAWEAHPSSPPRTFPEVWESELPVQDQLREPLASRLFIGVSLLHSSPPQKERRQRENFKEKELETGDPLEPREKQSEASTAAPLHLHPYGGDAGPLHPGPPGGGGRSCLALVPTWLKWGPPGQDRARQASEGHLPGGKGPQGASRTALGRGMVAVWQ